MSSYQEYQNEAACEIADCLKDMGCQPVLFMGSGIGRRYFGAPTWDQLLEQLVKENPLLKQNYIYYKQAHPSLPDVGESFVDAYHKWAWGVGRNKFPKDLYVESTHKSSYLKYYTTKLIKSIQPSGASSIRKNALKREIKALQKIRPNSIITTNYDQFIEMVFPEYTPIIGQKIIRASPAMIGEIFKIHGCLSEPNEIVFTRSDYDGWNGKKKYLSAKLLTYFLEHPVLILGYSAQDSNVLSILSDIDEILGSRGEVVSNIFYVIYDDTTVEKQQPHEVLLDLGGGKSMRVRALYANDFTWIFEAFAASEGVENVNPKLLRSLLARTYDLVRHDIPKATMEVDYTTLERAISEEDALPKLLGITSVSDPEMFNAAYPYTLTNVGAKLGFTGWYHAHALMKQIKEETGIDLKASDNQFHIAVKSGLSSKFHKYSDKLIMLLEKVRDKKPYDLKIKMKKGS